MKQETGAFRSFRRQNSSVCIFALAGRLKDFGISIERGASANGEAIRPAYGMQSAIFNRPNPDQAATASLKL